MKKLYSLLFAITLFLSVQSQSILNKAKNVLTGKPQVTEAEAGGGVKEALNNGITSAVSHLNKPDAFFKSELYKVLLPPEAQKMEKTLRDLGLGKMADDAIESINRGAEDAVGYATPIFVDAVRNMSFNDAKNILMGSESSATNYLQTSTTTPLYAKFNPVIKNSFAKVGADKVWTSIITKYNTIPFVTKVNPDLTDYTTNKALEGVFKMIAVEEKNIRTDIKARTSPLLQQVFAMQDKKF